MKNLHHFIIFILSILVLSASAKSVYVYDKAKLWSRTGPSNEYKVKLPLLPGTKLEVIEEDAITGFTHVRDIKDRDFWIKSEYLTTTPTANILLDDALNQIEKLSHKHQAEILSLQRKIKAMEPLEKINQKLQSQSAETKIQLEQLQQSNTAISSRFNREVFFAGGLTILVGIFLGWLISLRGKKRSSAWS